MTSRAREVERLSQAMQAALDSDEGNASALARAATAAGYPVHSWEIIRAIQRGDIPARRRGRRGQYIVRARDVAQWLVPAAVQPRGGRS